MKNIIDIMMERDNVSMSHSDYLLKTDQNHISDFLYSYALNHTEYEERKSTIEIINVLQPIYDKEYNKFKNYCKDYNIEPGIPIFVNNNHPTKMSYIIESIEKNGMITDPNFKFKINHSHYFTEGNKLIDISKESDDYIEDNNIAFNVTDKNYYNEYLSFYSFKLLTIIKKVNMVGTSFYEKIKPIIN